jgi:hypothetical protein
LTSTRWAPDTDPHQRDAAAAHHRLDVGEVPVDHAGVVDDVGDPLHAVAQHLVGQAERLVDRHLRRYHLEQAVVGDSDQGVDGAAQLLDPLVGDACPPHSLEGERLGHDGDR